MSSYTTSATAGRTLLVVGVGGAAQTRQVEPLFAQGALDHTTLRFALADAVMRQTLIVVDFLLRKATDKKDDDEPLQHKGEMNDHTWMF